jgi:beta-mannosidase
MRTLACLLIVMTLMIEQHSSLAEQHNTMNRLSLSDHWTFREASGSSSLPAEVPGCVHTDLMNNGQIPDPFFGTNEQRLHWIGERDWLYETEFDLPLAMLQHECVEMVFKGLDTYATVVLNGTTILKADNMFREWRVDCKPHLKEKANHLAITFRNVFDENLPKYRSAPFRLQAFGNNDQADVKIAMYSRKAQFHYGWDWGPRLITCGIWRPVYLEAWDAARIHAVRVQQDDVTAASADITSFLEVFSTAPRNAKIAVFMDSLTIGTTETRLHEGLNIVPLKGQILRPRLWWTNGLGEQYLYRYKATIALDDHSGDEYATSIGVRALEVAREKDSVGTSLYVRLNGVPVFMKGANYIPQDNFQNRVSLDRHEQTVRSAAQANMNMLRVWGGGIYEDDRFYEMCDRYGILIWHDMMFACAMYPADPEFLENVRHEILDNVSRIRNHPCLALYCGNNENEIGWYVWGWKQLYSAEIQATYERNMHTLFNEVIRDAVKEADPTRYYHPSSPSAGFGANSPYGGDIHYWGVWHGNEPFESYDKNIARFVSEYGFQSYPELSTIEKFTVPEDRNLHSDVMLAHQRCMADERRDKEYGNRLIQTSMERYFKMPKDFPSYLYASQLLQAEGVRKAIEAHRRNMPVCMGSLFWQIDDCWPVASWSSIDYYGKWKALHYVVRRAYAPIMVMPTYKNDLIEFQIVSDKRQPLEAVLEVAVQQFDGEIVFQRSMQITVTPNTSGRYAGFTRGELTGGRDSRRLILIARLLTGDSVVEEHVSHLVYPKDLDLQRPRIETRVTRTASGYAVRISTDVFAKSVYVSCEGVEGMFSDNYFDLLPREARTVTFDTAREIPEFEKKLKVMSLVDAY